MPQKVRKQIYIESPQNAALKRLAQARGVTQAEVVRRAIERETKTQEKTLVRPDPRAWEEARLFIASLSKRPPVSGPRTWEREDLYDR